MKSTVFKLATWSSCVTTICAQTLVSSLETRPELVLFNDYIQSIPTLLNTLTNITNYTLLAPSDTAMTRWLNETSPSPTQDEIEATLNYHILHGGYSLGSFSTVPQFASSYLSNSSFTNVTGGAVVELVEDGGNPVVVSALRVQSSITKGDLIANGGLFHIIDTVLSIPQQESATATEAGMEFYIDIMTKGGYLTGKSNDINNALGMEPDMTFFVPNSVAARDNFTSITAGWTTDQLDSLLTYHAIPGIVAYSSSMHNGTVLPTIQGEEITIYVGENGTMYANNVKILVTDYLISNGVMHTIDGVLNPYNITRPLIPPSPSTKKTAISTGAIIGIAIASAFVPFAVLAGALLYRRSKQTAAAKAKGNIYDKPPDGTPAAEMRDINHRKRPKGSAAAETSDKRRRSKKVSTTGSYDNRRRSKGSTSSRVTDSSHQNHSKRNSTTKTSQKSSHKQFESREQTKYEKEKARVEVEVRRVVGEQLDAFRRSGYYDAPSGNRPVVPVIPAVELDAGFSLVGRHELSGGEHVMPVIEEGHELSGGDVVKPAVEVEGAQAISMASCRAIPVIQEGRANAILRVSSRITPVIEEGTKAISRASSRAMVLDRR